MKSITKWMCCNGGQLPPIENDGPTTQKYTATPKGAPDGPKKEATLAPAGPVITMPKAPQAAAPAAEAAEEGQETPKGGSWRQLPLQLRRLPRDKTSAVGRSLAVLLEVGLMEVKDVCGLQEAVEAAMQAGEETEYRALCSWARTPASWRAAVGDLDPGAHCKLHGRPPQEVEKALRKQEERWEAAISNAPPKGAPPEEDLEKLKSFALKSRYRRTLRSRQEQGKAGSSPGFEEKFEEWWNAMLKANEQLYLMAEEEDSEDSEDAERKVGGEVRHEGNEERKESKGSSSSGSSKSSEGGKKKPRTLGGGLTVLFEKVDKVEPLPPPTLQGKAYHAAPALSKIALIVTGSAEPPKEPAAGWSGAYLGYVGHGKGFWFTNLSRDAWGKGPVAEAGQMRSSGRVPGPGAYSSVPTRCYTVSTQRKGGRAGEVKDTESKDPESKDPESKGPVERPAPAGPSAVLAVHVGGFGCGVGVAAWQRLFREHGLGADGRPSGNGPVGGLAPHFEESRTGRYVPRAVFADCDPKGLAGAREAGLFAPADLVQGPEDLQESWGGLADGQGSFCRNIMEDVRVQLEKADNTRLLMLTHSLEGFVGGGAAAVGLLPQLQRELPKCFIWNLALAPDQGSELEHRTCYNTVMSLWNLLEHSTAVTLVDEAALRRLASARPFGLGLEEPTHSDCSGLAARVLTGFTSSMRVGGLANASDGWSDLLPWRLKTNLVPYPKVKFTVACVAPLQPKEMTDFQTGRDKDFVMQCLTRGSLFSLDPEVGRWMSTGLWCRGVHHSIAIESLKNYKTTKDCQLVDWLPGSFAIGSQQDRPPSDPEVMALRNTTGVRKAFQIWGDAFDGHFNTLEGFDSYLQSGAAVGDFSDARESLAALVNDLDQVEQETADSSSSSSSDGG